MRTKSKTRVKHRVHLTLEMEIEIPDISPNEYTNLLRNLREEIDVALDKYQYQFTPNQELITLDEIGGSLNRISIN